MKDESYIIFLQWALPRLNLRWPGFRKVRGQVCKRIGGRLRELNLKDLTSYRCYLEHTPAEWQELDALCRITISRFYRNRGIFSFLQSNVIPVLVARLIQQGSKSLQCWCIGAASGEEPYSLSLLWYFSDLDSSGIELDILATDSDPHMLSRAVNGCYPSSSIRELDDEIIRTAFTARDGEYCIMEKHKKRVRFLQQDIRKKFPEGAFQLILCRNLAFTYFSGDLQKKIGSRIVEHLEPGGALVIGSHEQLPDPAPELSLWDDTKSIYQRKA